MQLYYTHQTYSLRYYNLLYHPQHFPYPTSKKYITSQNISLLFSLYNSQRTSIFQIVTPIFESHNPASSLQKLLGSLLFLLTFHIFTTFLLLYTTIYYFNFPCVTFVVRSKQIAPTQNILQCHKLQALPNATRFITYVLAH